MKKLTFAPCFGNRSFMPSELLRLARCGFKHYTSVGVGHMKAVLMEALDTYLHYDIPNKIYEAIRPLV